MPLDPAQLDFFHTHGYLALPGFFSARHVRGLRERLEELCAAWNTEPARRAGVQQEPSALRDGTPAPETVRKFSDLAREEALFYRHARTPELLGVVEQLLGLPLCLYADQALLKPPHHGSEKPEHQDNAYFRVHPPEHVITCWTAVDDADLENGCMHYYPGSHLRGLLPHTAIKGTPHLIVEGLDRADSTAVPVEAGGLILHHSLTVHWSPPNASDRWRRAFVSHFVRSDAEMGARHPNSPPLLEVRA